MGSLLIMFSKINIEAIKYQWDKFWERFGKLPLWESSFIVLVILIGVALLIANFRRSGK